MNIPDGKANHEELYQQIGKRVRNARRERNITQDVLAKRVHLSRTSVTNIEVGRQKLLVHKLADIASALELTIADLLPPASAKANGSDLDVQLSRLHDGERDFVKSIIQTKKPTTKKPEHANQAKTHPAADQ